MARIAYFSDQPDGSVIDLGQRIRHNGGRDLAANFSGYVNDQWVSATRKVEMKSMPSRHDCDARCFNATGRIMKCECSCGGKNHGRGAFNCEAA